MTTILDEILAHKREEVAARKRQRPESELRALAEQQGATRGFTEALSTAVGQGRAGVIAVVK